MTYKAQHITRRVAHVVLNLEVGGLEHLVVDLVNGLDRRFYDPMVICLQRKGALADRLKDCDVICLNKPDRFSPIAVLKLIGVLLKHKINIVHCHNTAGYLYGGLAAIFSGFKTIIYTEHGRVFPDSSRRMLAERILSRFTFKIAAVSKNMRDCLIKYEKLKPEKVQVLYNGIDTDRFKRIENSKWRIEKRKSLGLGPDDTVIGNIARLVDVKDHPTLLRAFKQLKQRLPVSLQDANCQVRNASCVRLLLVGDGPERNRLIRLCQELGLSYLLPEDHPLPNPPHKGEGYWDNEPRHKEAGLKSKEGKSNKNISLPLVGRTREGGSTNADVLFLGTRNDIPELLNIMDIYALSSKNEGVSLTLLEAIACSVPSVATRVGGNPEVIRQNKESLLCEPNDPSALADCILNMIREYVLGQVHLPETFLHPRFSLKAMIRRYEELYAKY